MPSNNECEEIHQCKRCGKYEIRPIEHDWTEWTPSNNECEEIHQSHQCKRCGKTETRSGHDWGESILIKNEFKENRQCKRCGKTDSHFVIHIPKGVIMVNEYYEGCKLVATIDKRSELVCALEVQFKNATVSRYLAESALEFWRPILATKGFVVPKALDSQDWKTYKPFGSPYQAMSLSIPGHNVDKCCGT
jgi:hypothetical protein